MTTTADSKDVAAVLRNSWPTWVAAVALLVAAVAALWTWAAVVQRQDDAVVAEWAVEAAEQQIAEAPDEIAGVESEVRLIESEVVVLEGMLQPGMAEALGGVYLIATVSGCEEGSTADPATLVSELPESAIPSALAAYPGWQTAIDNRSIEVSLLENCGG